MADTERIAVAVQQASRAAAAYAVAELVDAVADSGLVVAIAGLPGLERRVPPALSQHRNICRI